MTSTVLPHNRHLTKIFWVTNGKKKCILSNLTPVSSKKHFLFFPWKQNKKLQDKWLFSHYLNAPKSWGTLLLKAMIPLLKRKGVGVYPLESLSLYWIENHEIFFVSFTKFSLPVIRQQLASSLLTILQTSEYGLSNACFVFSLLLYSSYQDFADLMVFFF